MRRGSDPYDGLLLVDKPAGPTSHDVVDAIRRCFAFSKVGHGGTLDPMATGLLVILLGRGTKASNLIIGSDKEYQGIMRLGMTTDTDDVDGRELERRDCSGVTRESLEAAMKNLTGDIFQTPPMVSAIKKDGVPLYKLARQGRVVEREPRLIHIYEFSLLRFDPPDAAFRLRCTKGTYVRVLCADVGRALGCGAYLHELRRVRSGRLDVADAVPLEKLLQMELDDLKSLVIPVYQLLGGGAHG
jgi:tRNA pseudouridine55 synthase